MIAMLMARTKRFAKRHGSGPMLAPLLRLSGAMRQPKQVIGKMR
jgi:hypothetical protein